MTDTATHCLEASTTVFVGGLSINVTEQTLKSYMQTFGEVRAVEIQARGGISRGFGKVYFAEISDARMAVQEEHYLANKRFTCCFYVPPEIAKERLQEEKKRKIFVSGISQRTTERHLKDYFSYFGDVERAAINRYIDDTSKGTGFVLFRNDKTTSLLLSTKKYKEHHINGAWITIYQCLSKNDIIKHSEILNHTKKLAPCVRSHGVNTKASGMRGKQTAKPTSTTFLATNVEMKDSRLRNTSEPFLVTGYNSEKAYNVQNQTTNHQPWNDQQEEEPLLRKSLEKSLGQEKPQTTSTSSRQHLSQLDGTDETDSASAVSNMRYNIASLLHDLPQQARYLRWLAKLSGPQLSF